MNPLEAAEAVKVKYTGTDTKITLPSSLLWICVFGGIGMLTWNASLVRDQLRDQDHRIDAMEKELNFHEAQAGHALSSKFQLLLEQKLRQLEEENAARQGAE